MNPLTIFQVKLLCEAALSKKGYSSQPGSRHEGDWQVLMDGGYVSKLPKRGMSDYETRFVATELGKLRLTDPSACLVLEVLES